MELTALAARKMENAGFEREDSRACCSGSGSGSSTVEMSEVHGDGDDPSAPAAPPRPPPALTSLNGNGAITCSEHCQTLHLQHQKHYEEKGEPPAPESPWHHLKTIFLVGTLIFLALWILVYTLLSQLELL